MAQKNIQSIAAAYAEIAAEIKEKEKELKPLKEKLLQYASFKELKESEDLGAVSILVKNTFKRAFDLKKVDLPHFIWELIDNGFGGALKIDIDPSKLNTDVVSFDGAKLNLLLSEIDFTETPSSSYAIKLN